MLFDIRLINNTATIGSKSREYLLEWLAFSDDPMDFAGSIAMRGMITDGSNMTGTDGRAKGWYPAGRHYRFGNHSDIGCFANEVEVSDMLPLSSNGNQYVVIHNGTIIYQKDDTGTPVTKWHIRQRYSTETEEGGGTEEHFPTEDDPITISSHCEWEDIPFTFDADGKIVRNSAGDLFNPPAIRRRRIPVYSITRKEWYSPMGIMLYYANTVNADDYFGMPPGTMLMDVTPNYDGKKWMTTYTIREKQEGWNTELLDMGYNEWLPDGRVVPILDNMCVPISEPALLNGYGRLAPPGTLGTYVGPFKKFSAMPFSLLNLPNPFTIQTARNV